jgi:hypothetical protein
MKNIIYSIISTLLFATINVTAQVYYKPNTKAKEIYDEISSYRFKLSWLQSETKKSLGQIEKSLIKCIKNDSNFAQPYAALGNIKMLENDFLSKNGAFSYYSKYLEKSKKYPIKEDCPIYYKPLDRDDEFNGGGCVNAIKVYRLLSFSMGYNLNPEYFIPKNGFFSFEELSNYIKLCEDDLENFPEIIQREDNSKLYQAYFTLYTIKGELEFNQRDYKNSAISYKLLLGKLKNKSENFNEKSTIKLLKRQVYEKLYNLFISIGDRESALNSLIEFYKIPFNETDFNSINFQKKRKEIFRLINEINGFSPNDYEICQINGKEVFCENKNIELENYSSSVQFLRAYNNNNLLDIIFGIEPNNFDNNGIRTGDYYNNFSSKATIKNIYSFYLKTGREEGLIWPKYKTIDYANDLVKEIPSLMANLYNCRCFNRLLDVKVDYLNGVQIFVASKKDSTLTVRTDVSQDWQILNKMPITYFDFQNQTVTHTSQGLELPKYSKCEKLYLIEKQNYENSQALLLAKRMQQDAEVLKLQQLQNYKETQLRLIEEENRKNEKEIELVNAKTLQVEKSKELEAQKSTNAFMKYVFQSKNNSSQSSSETKNSNQSQKQWVNCSRCHGSGLKECSSCDGKGSLEYSKQNGYGTELRTCTSCGGKGSRGECGDCKGRGQVQE